MWPSMCRQAIVHDRNGGKKTTKPRTNILVQKRRNGYHVYGTRTFHWNSIAQTSLAEKETIRFAWLLLRCFRCRYMCSTQRKANNNEPRKRKTNLFYDEAASGWDIWKFLPNKHVEHTECLCIFFASILDMVRWVFDWWAFYSWWLSHSSAWSTITLNG